MAGDSCVSGIVGAKMGIIGSGTGGGIDGATRLDDDATTAVGCGSGVSGAAMAVIGC